MDVPLRIAFALLLGPLFIALGIYLARGRALPGQSRVLHVRLGAGSIAMGVLVVGAALIAP
ncbi:MAG: hypothetical protein FJ033_03905 [Chloroflexi bacterium]|nr:hypothetical protein [Chloroflexota bacterium]